MPNRIIRETILTSDKVDQLDPPAEVFYRRLLSKVDDYGRYDARLAVLRASLFPLRLDRVREADCSRWIAACEKAGLIVLYSHDGKSLLEVTNTEWKRRSPSKYAAPTSENICSQVQTNARLVVDVDVVVDVEKQAAPPAALPPAEAEAKANSGTRLPAGWVLPDDWRSWAVAKRPDLDVSEQADKFADHFRAKPGKDGRKTDWEATWRNWIRNERQKFGAPAQVRNPAVPQGKPSVDSESPLEKAVNLARHKLRNGWIDEAECQRLIAEATDKHRRAA